jgi:hypothetical protein
MVRVPGVPLYLTDINCRCIDPNNINQRILNPAAWQDVGVGQISPGSGYYNDYRGPHQVSENMNFGRTFQLREKMTLNVRAEFFNVFNRGFGYSELQQSDPDDVRQQPDGRDQRVRILQRRQCQQCRRPAYRPAGSSLPVLTRWAGLHAGPPHHTR